LLSTLLPLVYNFDGDVKRNEMQNCVSCMKHEQVMHTHSSRCIPHIRMGIGDNSDCTGGFKPGRSKSIKTHVGYRFKITFFTS